MANDIQKQVEAMRAKAAEMDGVDSFRMKILRRTTSESSPMPYLTVDGVTCDHIANHDVWLNRIVRGGGKFEMTLHHPSDFSRVVCKIPNFTIGDVNNPPRPPKMESFQDPAFLGPRGPVIFPDPNSTDDEAMTMGGIPQQMPFGAPGQPMGSQNPFAPMGMPFQQQWGGPFGFQQQVNPQFTAMEARLTEEKRQRELDRAEDRRQREEDKREAERKDDQRRQDDERKAAAAELVRRDERHAHDMAELRKELATPKKSGMEELLPLLIPLAEKLFSGNATAAAEAARAQIEVAKIQAQTQAEHNKLLLDVAKSSGGGASAEMLAGMATAMSSTAGVSVQMMQSMADMAPQGPDQPAWVPVAQSGIDVIAKLAAGMKATGEAEKLKIQERRRLRDEQRSGKRPAAPPRQQLSAPAKPAAPVVMAPVVTAPVVTAPVVTAPAKPTVTPAKPEPKQAEVLAFKKPDPTLDGLTEPAPKLPDAVLPAADPYFDPYKRYSSSQDPYHEIHQLVLNRVSPVAVAARFYDSIYHPLMAPRLLKAENEPLAVFADDLAEWALEERNQIYLLELLTELNKAGAIHNSKVEAKDRITIMTPEELIDLAAEAQAEEEAAAQAADDSAADLETKEEQLT